jgi:uncharacterized protein YbjT (DUF2867 family)
LRLLLADDAFTKVVSAGRRLLPIEHATPGRLTQAKVDFADAASFEALPAADVAFSCLGTTIKKAGSREAFRAVDHDAVVAFAKAARAKGARAFVHVSSLGAAKGSRSFYSSVKGDVEEAVTHLGFESVHALRPSILDGGTRNREESRPLERASLVVMRALGPVLGKYRPTAIEAVARTMVALAKKPTAGSHVVEPDAIA